VELVNVNDAVSAVLVLTEMIRENGSVSLDFI
jgi:hypothetical protein